MIHIKRFIDKVSIMEAKQGKDVVIPISEARGLRDEVSKLITDNYELLQNYPNPFNPGTKIEFKIPATGFVTLKVFDILGNEVATLVNEELKQGSYSFNFEAAKLASGIYFYSLKAGNFNSTKKMILLK